MRSRKAVAETDALLSGQWCSGAIPYILFTPKDVESYFPDLKNCHVDTTASCGLVRVHVAYFHTPVHAISRLYIFDNAAVELRADRLVHLHDVYLQMAMGPDCLYSEQKKLRHGLEVIRHMFKSDIDTLLAWDSMPVVPGVTTQARFLRAFRRYR